MQEGRDSSSSKPGDKSFGSAPGSDRLSMDHDLTRAKTVIRGSSKATANPGIVQPKQGTPATVAKVLLGKHLNHFLLEELIGGGGMGAVFRAHDEQLDRIVAIKVIPFVGEDPDLQRRFRNEAQNAAKLDHPKIARVFDAGSQDDWHYIVFEHIDGVNIRDLVTNHGVLSVDQAVLYTCQLGEALQHASDRGIVHRDVKPSNVLVTKDEQVRLVDMGLARSASLELTDDMTASGVTLGTFDYISPEQAKDPRDTDLRSDLYSLGCTLYFMLTGFPPFPGGTTLQKLLSHGNTPPPDVQAIRRDVSTSLKSVIEKMLAKRPADRYQTAHDLLADLDEVARRDGLQRTQLLNPDPVSPARSWLLLVEQHSPWVIAAVLMLLVAGWLQLQSYAYRGQTRVPGIGDSGLGMDRMTRQGSGSSLPNGLNEGIQADDSSIPTNSEQISASMEQAQASNDAGGVNDQIDLRPETIVNESDSQEVGENADARMPTDSQVDEIENVLVSPEVNAATSSEDSAEEMLNESSGVMPEITVVRVVSVLQEQEKLESGVVETSDFEFALDLAQQHPSTSRIELTVPLLVCSKPITLASDDLLITSTIGGTTIVFQSNDSLVMSRTKMFSIGSHPVVFEDIHFVWNVAPDDLNGGCLFEVNPNELVRFTDCSITVNNRLFTDEVYAFDVITDPSALRVDELQSEEKLPLVWLELNNAIIRGQMTMLHMDFATKLWLDWDNGLLSVTDRMIDTAGALYPPDPVGGTIRMKLWRVTSHVPKGLFLMRVGVSGAYPVAIDRLAHECVFWVNPGLPHFDLRGFPSVSDGISIKFQGASNTYVTDGDQSDPMLRVSSPLDDRRMVFMKEIAEKSVPWAADKSPRWSVNWEFEGLSELPFDQRLPANYRQMDPNPLGFDEKALPSLPERAEFDDDAVQAALSNQSIR